MDAGRRAHRHDNVGVIVIQVEQMLTQCKHLPKEQLSLRNAPHQDAQSSFPFPKVLFQALGMFRA